MYIIPLIPYLFFKALWLGIIAFVLWYIVIPVFGTIIALTVGFLILISVGKWLDKKEAKKKQAIIEAKAEEKRKADAREKQKRLAAEKAAAYERKMAEYRKEIERRKAWQDDLKAKRGNAEDKFDEVMN